MKNKLLFSFVTLFIFIMGMAFVNKAFAIDSTPLIAVASHVQSSQAITYTFSEPVHLIRQSDVVEERVETPLSIDLLGIYELNAYMSYKTGDHIPVKMVQIESATLNGNILSITYLGVLPEGSYIVDAWGYDITDLEGNRIIQSPTQIFTIDTVAPTATVLHDLDSKTITYKFDEPVQLMSADFSTVIPSTEYKTALAIYDYAVYSTHVKFAPEPVHATGILSATLSSDAKSISIVYSDSLIKHDDMQYVVDAWGLNITDVFGNKMLPAATQIFSVAGDKTAPTLTLKGSNPVTVFVGDNYVDAGATAIDNIDGDITSKIVTNNPVNTQISGYYTIVYNVSDNVGNPANSISRNVFVNKKNQAVLTVNNVPAVYGSDLTLTTTGGSNAGVLSFSGTGDCNVSGSTLSPIKAGVCHVTAQMAGNYMYMPVNSPTADITINKADQQITWANPASITYGTALDSSVLNATSNGIADNSSASYSPASGTVLGSGDSQDLTVNFSTTNSYNAGSKTVKLSVTKRPITLMAVSNTKTTDGSASASGLPSITTGTLATGDTAVYSEVYDNATVGTSKTLTPSIVIKNASNIDVTSNYEITSIQNNRGIILANDQSVPTDGVDGRGDATLNNEDPELVLTNLKQPVDVLIVSGATNPRINISSFIEDGTGYIPQITINSNVANIAIPASTITSADPAWNGIIAAPTVTTVTLPNPSGETRQLSTAIEVGFSGAKLSFDKAVRILLPNQAGKRAGYTRTGTAFTEITNVCATDDKTVGDSLSIDGDCKINVGSDLVIWTKHFTSFATYTQTRNVIGSGGGSSVGAYASSNQMSDAANRAKLQALIDQLHELIKAKKGAQGEVLGASTFNFARNLRIGLNGNDIMELQSRLRAEGYFTFATNTGYFGQATHAAVKAFQKAHNIAATGFVGKLTLAELNK